MRKNKRFLSLILVILMLFTAALAVTAAENDNLDTVVETEIKVPEELVPMMANRCYVNIGGWNGGYPGDDGSVAPGAGWEWRGTGIPGSNAGSWIIFDACES